MVIVITDLKVKRQAIMDILSEEFVFPELDKFKQKGFYSHVEEGVFKSNSEAIDLELAKAVLEFTWRITDTLKSVLGESIENYKNLFLSLRNSIDEDTLKQIRKVATKTVESIFGFDSD